MPPRAPNRLLYIAALGNPGAKYARTRHNAGSLLLDALLPRLQTRWAEANLHPFVATKRPTHYMNESGRGLVAAMMNFFVRADRGLSMQIPGLQRGEGVPATLVLLHDELESAPGKLKVRYGGPESFSLRGHRGLEDVFATLDKKKMWNLGAKRGEPDPREVRSVFVKGSEKAFKDAPPREFAVLRIGYGIGRPETRGREDVADYVLAEMDPQEAKRMEAAVDQVVMALEKELYRGRVYAQGP
ncbi:hypothetical protein N7468_004973 [Penicillium chermesinum]|uniref:peptidyl-tRNA hydrolase n=1 Tax=Penicillium chermesinum TaxID=63820 RepID=A0A9W9P0Q5_9EURO|nr:uncharacterized protein N7468_004973 [Penicillium chermesinum]KAJ5232017.1 hypothetical protein N7468_004973 [Penicillium chermesinum]